MLRITAGVTRFGQADIVKQIWKELPKHMDTPVAPLDEEMLVDLAKEPAVIEGAWKADGMVGIFGSKPCYILVFLLHPGVPGS